MSYLSTVASACMAALLIAFPCLIGPTAHAESVANDPSNGWRRTNL